MFFATHSVVVPNVTFSTKVDPGGVFEGVVTPLVTPKVKYFNWASCAHQMYSWNLFEKILDLPLHFKLHATSAAMVL